MSLREGQNDTITGNINYREEKIKNYKKKSNTPRRQINLTLFFFLKKKKNVSHKFHHFIVGKVDIKL